MLGGEAGLLTDPVGLENLVGYGVPRDVEELATADGMHPQLVVDPSGVVTEEEVIAPLLVRAGLRVRRAGNMRLALGMKLLFLAVLLAVGAVDEKHGVASLVSNAGRTVLVDESTGVETVDGERGREGMGLVLGQGPGKDVTRAWGGLEAASAPTAVEK